MTKYIKFFLTINFLSLLFTSTPTAFGKENYKLPNSNTDVTLDADTSLLKKLSDGIHSITKSSKKALVYIEVNKKTQATKYNEPIDPFEFFFNPHRKSPQRNQKGLGSGFIVDLKKGYILLCKYPCYHICSLNLFMRSKQRTQFSPRPDLRPTTTTLIPNVNNFINVVVCF